MDLLSTVTVSIVYYLVKTINFQNQELRLKIMLNRNIGYGVNHFYLKCYKSSF